VEFSTIAIIFEPMKNCLLLLSVILSSCKNEDLSPEEKQILQTHITRHNIATEARFVQDSIHELQEHRAKYQLKYKTGFSEFLKDHMILFSNNWNRPYNINKDRTLTLDSYLDYCGVHKYNPKEQIKNIN